MRAGEVRARVLADHVAIRDMLLSLERAAQQVLSGERWLLAGLRLEGETLLRRLEDHMGWEERHLAPALRAADPAGEERAAGLDRDHREQREVLAHCLVALRDEGRPGALIARKLVDLVALLREDMQEEERLLLDERVLRDASIAVDAESPET
jgi:hypothetical protein